LSLIVPTYNESENIVELVNRIESTLAKFHFEIIIVDDKSPDGTANITNDLNIKYGNIFTYVRPGKLGLSSAILYGFDKAHSKVLAVIDADIQHPPEILAKMRLKISEGFDLVVASRYTKGGGTEDWALYRIILSRGGNLLAHLLFPSSRKVKDVMSGCFMFKRDIANGIYLNPIGFKILLEILAKCDFKLVTELPITFINRNNGRSNLNLTEIQNFVIHILKIFSSKLQNHG